MVTENIHHRDGTAHGDFAEYVSELQQVGLEAREEVFARSFKELVYSSEAVSRFFPLSDCSVARAEIQGQHFDMLWKGVSFTKCDFSHVRGVGHWSSLEFDEVVSGEVVLKEEAIVRSNMGMRPNRPMRRKDDGRIQGTTA